MALHTKPVAAICCGERLNIINSVIVVREGAGDLGSSLSLSGGCGGSTEEGESSSDDLGEMHFELKWFVCLKR